MTAFPSILHAFLGDETTLLEQSGLLTICAVVLVVGWLVISAYRQNRRYSYPNLVPGLPFFGNSFQIPFEDQGPYMTKIAEKTGEMFTMKFGRTPWVFLNSRRVVNELLEKRAALYSDRQNLPMANELCSAGRRLVIMPYGPDWRKQRKAMHQILANTKSKLFEPYQDIESRTLLFHYLQQPERWWEANGRYANSIILSVTYGKRSNLGDAQIQAVSECLEDFGAYLTPGQCLVDNLPWLLKVPLPKSWQPWRWWGDAVFKRTRSVHKKIFDDFLERRRLGTQKPCFMTELIDKNQNAEFTEEEYYFISGTLIEAGSDTTRVSILMALAGARAFPDWVERAQKQLDSVCGSQGERLPELSDMDSLPLIKAAIKESLRWKPAFSATGLPHALVKDDTFEDFTFRAGTVVTFNSWAISHLDYKDPECFYPERFLDEDLDTPTKGHSGFGFGRRVCVGNSVAWHNLLIALSRLLYCFDVQPVPGDEIDISKPVDIRSGHEPFKLIIKPRSEAHTQLILRECTKAAEIDDIDSV